MIYRSNRLVNWSCALKTAISDVEVNHERIEEPITRSIANHDGKYEFGVLIHFAYKLKEYPSTEIIVATTRIETMLGDVAVGIHLINHNILLFIIDFHFYQPSFLFKSSYLLFIEL